MCGEVVPYGIGLSELSLQIENMQGLVVVLIAVYNHFVVVRDQVV